MLDVSRLRYELLFTAQQAEDDLRKFFTHSEDGQCNGIHIVESRRQIDYDRVNGACPYFTPSVVRVGDLDCPVNGRVIAQPKSEHLKLMAIADQQHVKGWISVFLCDFVGHFYVTQDVSRLWRSGAARFWPSPAAPS